jgi:hypothetical protein
VSTEGRIAMLEAQVAAAQAEIAKLKGDPPHVTPPQPAKDKGLRITYLVEPSSFVRPTQNELHKLHDIVLAKYPQFSPQLSLRWASQEKQEYFDGFEWAFERLGFIGRSATPDHKHYVDFWCSECRDWLRLHRPAHCGNIGAGFLAAAIAHGDICFTPSDEQRGIVWAVGLTALGGTKASDAWRRVLDGKLMAPVAPEQRFA